jgi:DNA-binding transcriptional MerR regulator
MTTSALWTLDELVDRVRQALAHAPAEDQVDRRVRDVPDRRAIRWYTTIGLVDRPSGMRGRTALYGQRHLFQLTAVKRMQATGLSLAEIQPKLVWMDDHALREIADIPEFLLNGDPLEPYEQRSSMPRSWVERSDSDGQAGSGAADDVTTVTNIRLADGVTLGLSAKLGKNNIVAIRKASEPLLQLLGELGLTSASAL